MKIREAYPLILVLLILVLGGCSGQPPSSEESTKTEQNPSIDLVPLTFDEWESKLQEYQGKIVVVDMWATWCAPCIERFPHMVELHNKYRDREIAFVSLSLDDREDQLAIQYAREFLTEQKATFDNYLMNEGGTDGFEKLGLLGIPAVFIYGSDGELRFRLTMDDPNNQFSSEDVDRAIEELLGG